MLWEFYSGCRHSPPKGSAQGRGQTMAMLSETVYALNANPENEALYLIWRPIFRSWTQWTGERLSYSKVLQPDFQIPPQEYIEYDVLLNDAQAVWEQAKNTDDFALLPHIWRKL